MGTWGSGLYSGDFACDLRATITAVSRLPFDGNRILEILCGTEPNAAGDPKDADHATFWLVAADQLQKHGIDCDAAVKKALSIIDSGAADRLAKISELKQRLTQGIAPKRRAVLAKPQQYTMDVGEVLAYPVSRGQPINPYAADSKKQLRWTQDAWAAMLVVTRGRAFDYLAWYSIMVVKPELAEKPELDHVFEMPWALRGAGTCSSTHFKRMELEPVGRVTIDSEALAASLGKPHDGTRAAILDVSICNSMSVVSKDPSQPFVQPKLERLGAVRLTDIVTAQ